MSLMDSADPNAFAPDFLQNEVLVYGPRKSGTTLLQSLLDGSSQFLMLPGEGKVKFLFEPRIGSPYLLRYALQIEKKDWSFNRASIGAAALSESTESISLPGLSPEGTARVLDLEKYKAGLQKLHDEQPNHTFTRLSKGDISPPEYSQAQQERQSEVAAFAASIKTAEYSRDGADASLNYWATKEVGGQTREIIERLRKLSPNLKIVYLVREPRFIVRSIILDRRRKGNRLGFWKIIKECEAAQNIIADAFLHSLGRDIIVTYEELTRDTQSEMQRVATALGIEFEEKLCVPTVLGAPAIVRTSSQKTQQVFQTEKSWHDDLLPYQKNAIHWFHLVMPIISKLRGRKFVHYETLLKELKKQPGN